MPTTDISIPGTATLSDIELFAQQEEEINGPLVNLGNAGPDSILTFDMDALPPNRPIVLRVAPGATPPQIDGFALVSQGNCLVAGRLTSVAAFRAAPEQAPVGPIAVGSPIPIVPPGSALEAEL